MVLTPNNYKLITVSILLLSSTKVINFFVTEESYVNVHLKFLTLLNSGPDYRALTTSLFTRSVSQIKISVHLHYIYVNKFPTLSKFSFLTFFQSYIRFRNESSLENKGTNIKTSPLQVDPIDVRTKKRWEVVRGKATSSRNSVDLPTRNESHRRINVSSRYSYERLCRIPRRSSSGRDGHTHSVKPPIHDSSCDTKV